MHHDLGLDQPRVSKNTKISVALEELLCRNIHLYDEKYKFLLNSNVRYLQGRYTLMDMFMNILYKKNAKPLYHFFLQNFAKDD